MKTSQPFSFPLYYFFCLFRHKPINSALSSQPLINPFRTEIMLKTGDWGQAWNEPSCSVVMTKFMFLVWSVCVFVLPCMLCVCVWYLLIITISLLKLHTCVTSLLSLAYAEKTFLHAHTHTPTLGVVCYTLCGICNMFLLSWEACRPHWGLVAFCSCRGQPHTFTGSDVVINLCQTKSGRVC